MPPLIAPMANQRFKGTTYADRVAQRKQARLNKQAASTVPAPRFSTDPPAPAASPAPVPQTYEQMKSGVQDDAQSSKNFEDIFLSIIAKLPADQQGRAFTLFSVFRQQTPAQQKEVLDGLMQTAQQSTAGQYGIDTDRIKQDADYQKAQADQAVNQGEALYQKLVQDTDLNLVRTKAADDKQLAQTIQSITNTGFVNRVAQSGIMRRRTMDQISAEQTQKEDAQIQADQAKQTAALTQGNLVQRADALKAHQDVLEQRQLDDAQQKNVEDTNSLFLTQFENTYAGQGDDARANISPTDAIAPGPGQVATAAADASSVLGVNGVTVQDYGAPSADIKGGADGTTRADVLSQGTDAQRVARTAEETRVANSKAEDARISALHQSYQDAHDRLFALNNVRVAMRYANQDTSAVDAEIDRLKPIVKGYLDKTSDVGGGVDLNVLLQSAADEYTYNGAKLIGQYGSSPLNMDNVNKVLNDNKALLATVGNNDFSDLSPAPDIPTTNKYGSSTFDQSLALPANQSRADVLASAQQAQVNPGTPFSPATQRTSTLLPAGWTQGQTAAQDVATLGDLRKGIQPSAYTPPPVVAPVKSITATSNPGTTGLDRIALRRAQLLAQPQNK